MIKRLWKWRLVRVVVGIWLVLVGVILGLLPGPGGFIFWLPGVIILLADVPFLRIIAARFLKFFRKFKFARLFMRKMRVFIKDKTGWSVWFKKREKGEKD